MKLAMVCIIPFYGGMVHSLIRASARGAGQRTAFRRATTGTGMATTGTGTIPTLSSSPTVKDGESVRSSGGAGSIPLVALEAGKAKLFQDGNPLVYGGAIKSVVGDPSAGDEVEVTDHRGNSIGRGFYNPYSQYRVRMITRSYETIHKLDITSVLRTRLEQAIHLRRQINLPNPLITTAYRLVNGEGDRLGGLIIDVFGNTVVIQSTALWVEIRKEMILSILSNLFGSEFVLLWRQADARLKQDGYNITTTSTTTNIVNTASIDTSLLVYENGIKFSVNTDNSQKTGFYCDQRDNRARIGSISAGKSVLDMYCYSAGFSMYAAVNGATRYLDNSKSALQ